MSVHADTISEYRASYATSREGMNVNAAALEELIRTVVREELQSARPAVPVATTFPQDSIAGAVRAELARARKTTNDLIDALGLGRPTVYGRLSGAYPFTTRELDTVATLFGITAYNIIESASLGQRFNTATPNDLEIERVFAPDVWAQPARSLSAARRRK